MSFVRHFSLYISRIKRSADLLQNQQSSQQYHCIFIVFMATWFQYTPTNLFSSLPPLARFLFRIHPVPEQSIQAHALFECSQTIPGRASRLNLLQVHVWSRWSALEFNFPGIYGRLDSSCNLGQGIRDANQTGFLL